MKLPDSENGVPESIPEAGVFGHPAQAD